jgi:hypothetical protein
MGKKYLTLVETYLSRFERGGFLVGDVFKFNDNFKSSEAYKKLGYNSQELIDQMIDTGLHVRVVGIKDTTSPRYPGNPQTSSADVSLTLAVDNGGGRYTHYVNIAPELGTSVSFYPNLPPIPDAMTRPNNVNVKPKELETQDHISNKTDKGDGKLSDTNISLATANTVLKSNSVTADPAVSANNHEYLKGLAVFK